MLAIRLIHLGLKLIITFGSLSALAIPASAPPDVQHIRTIPNGGVQNPRRRDESNTCSISEIAETIFVPQSKPANAVQVPGNFVGFGFETAFLNDFAVGRFSENLVNSVAKRLGEPLVIRIGGTSGDRFQYDPEQKEDKVCINGDCPVGSSATYILGPSYFNGFRRFRKQHFTFQARLGANVNYTASLEYVNCAYHVIGADRVDAIAIGNEPDTYAGYTLEEYVQATVDLESAIVSKLGLSNKRIFEVLDSAGGKYFGDSAMEPAFTQGLDRKQRTKYLAQHYYQSPLGLLAYGAEEMQTYLMNHSAITSKFEQGYLSTLKYMQETYPDIGYIISESGSSLIGPPKSYQASFGACLWYVDYNLYAMSIGVKRLDGTGRPAAPHSFWVPNRSTNSPTLGAEQNIGPQVRGPYYATPMLGDFLGPSSGAIVQLLGEDTKTVYALYDSNSGVLSRVALVNLRYWSADTGGDRGSETFNIPVGSGVQSVVVKRLHADAGAHAAGYDVQGANGMITWAGETWSYELDHGEGSTVRGVRRQERERACNGTVSVSVPDSEAVIVFISRSS